MKAKCPSCGKALIASKPEDFPFCSDRCRMADLGKWLNEEYFIPGEIVQEIDNEYE